MSTFFRNATAFRLPAEYMAHLSVADLEQAFSQHPLRACGPLEMFTRGFVPPQAGAAALAVRVGDALVFALGTEERVVPPATLAAEVAKRIERYTTFHGRPPGGKARRQIKADALDELMPKALTKPSATAAYLDLKRNLVVVDTASRKQAEQVLGEVRRALDSFPAVPLVPSTPAKVILTDWLRGTRVPAMVSLGDACELKDAASGATVRVRKQDLDVDEVRQHLDKGKLCVKLNLTHADHVTFDLREDLSLAGIGLLADALAQLDDSVEDADAQYHADMVLMTGEFAGLFDAMADWFGIAA